MDYGCIWSGLAPYTGYDSSGHPQAKEELVDILDKLKAANFNTVLFQTRTRGDVLYPSSIEPFNSILTGKVGIRDMIRWLCDWGMPQAGMECHAWMVTIPLGNKSTSLLSANNLSPSE